MNAAKKKIKRKPALDAGMKKPLIYSTGLHIFIVILITVGLPFVIPTPPPEEMAITVELADLAAISESPIVDKPNESEKPEPTPPKPVEPKPVYKPPEPEPTPPPDDLLTPQKPEVEEVPEPPEEKAPEPEEKLAEVKPPPKPMNKPKPPKPKAQEKPKEEPKKEEPKEPEKDISSLLKSLTTEEAPDEKKVDALPQELETQGQTSQLSRQGANLTRSEEDALKGHFYECWNVNAGGKYAEELVVPLEVFLNPDMSVRAVNYVEQLRIASDSHYRAAAEAARRALLNPVCRNLPLPPEKYEQYKVIQFTFDPREML